MARLWSVAILASSGLCIVSLLTSAWLAAGVSIVAMATFICFRASATTPTEPTEPSSE